VTVSKISVIFSGADVINLMISYDHYFIVLDIIFLVTDEQSWDTLCISSMFLYLACLWWLLYPQLFLLHSDVSCCIVDTVLPAFRLGICCVCYLITIWKIIFVGWF
jgi:hypothetical protein